MKVSKEGATETLQITLPPESSGDEVQPLLAIELCEVGQLPLRKGEKLVGYPKRSFMGLLRN